MNPTVTVKSSGGADLADLGKRLHDLSRAEVYVGIPEANDRQGDLLSRAAGLKKTKSGKLSKKASKLIAASEGDISNAQLMFIHTHGSPVRGIPARPVIEPAIEAEDNKEAIAEELQGAAVAMMDGNGEGALKKLKRAGMTAASRARGWFTDPRNGWAPNSTKPLGPWLAKKLSEKYGREITPDMSYVDAKGSDKPLIDTGEMRKSVTYVVSENAGTLVTE